MSGFRRQADGHGGGVTRRQLLRNGVLGVAAVYGATPARLGGRSGSRRSPRRPSRWRRASSCIYLNGGNDGLNSIVPTETSAVRQVPVAAPDHRPRARPRHGHGRSARRVDPAGTGSTLALRQPSSSPAPAPTRTATPRASTRSTATAPAARGPISRSSRRPTTTRPTARTSRAATTGSPARSAQLQTGWLGRWLDAYGSQVEPAPGGLARLAACRSRSAPRRRPCARSRASAGRRLRRFPA